MRDPRAGAARALTAATRVSRVAVGHSPSTHERPPPRRRRSAEATGTRGAVRSHEVRIQASGKRKHEMAGVPQQWNGVHTPQCCGTHVGELQPRQLVAVVHRRMSVL